MVEGQIYGQENGRKIYDQRHDGAKRKRPAVNSKPKVLRDALHKEHACRHEDNGGDKKAQNDSPHLQRFLRYIRQDEKKSCRFLYFNGKNSIISYYTMCSKPCPRFGEGNLS